MSVYRTIGPLVVFLMHRLILNLIALTLRLLFLLMRKYYVAQYMSLGLQSKGVEVPKSYIQAHKNPNTRYVVIQAWTPQNRRCDQVFAKGEHHLPTIMHPPCPYADYK